LLKIGLEKSTGSISLGRGKRSLARKAVRFATRTCKTYHQINYPLGHLIAKSDLRPWILYS